MKTYYKTENGKLFCCDILEGFKAIPDNSVNCVVTSPPYWQLRDYGYSEQWGLEPTYQEYLAHLWQMMDEIWRVLKDDGTVWINLGDSYSTISGGMRRGEMGKISNRAIKGQRFEQTKPKDIKPKCLLLIPHRFAIGCIDRGWIMRNDIIWAKRNGMPESVTDRFSKKHEYFFFMTKNQKYYFNLDGVRDRNKTFENRPAGVVRNRLFNYDSKTNDKTLNPRINNKHTGINKSGYAPTEGNSKGKNPGDVSDFWDIPTKPSSKKHYATYNFNLIDKCIIAGCPKGGTILDPFNGSGTTTLRSEQLERKWIGIDGSVEYSKIAKMSIENEMSQIKINFE